MVLAMGKLLEIIKTNIINMQDIFISIGIVILAIIFGLILNKVLRFMLSKWGTKLAFDVKDMTLNIGLLRAPFRMLIPALCLVVVFPFLRFPEQVTLWIRHFLVIWIIISLAWLLTRLVTMIKALVLSRYELEVKDNLKARQVSTQIGVIQRILNVIIIIFAIATILMTFDKVRQIGVSILASAGIAGIIIGFAAQRSLATLIAGIQIAITQPIRIDDVVIVENEWGRIEEITLTYVVVNIWDQRRLILPITYFIEKPFQNWTRTTSELLGTVFIYADYRLPIDGIRRELERIVQATPLWDKRLAKIQVTNANEKTMEVRALVSAENSSNAWELRCHVREKLIEFLQKHYPDSLPRVRLEMDETIDRTIKPDIH
jgi:small-conductance mechanosensitive channel